MSSVLFDARRNVARARPLVAGLVLLAMPPEMLRQALAAAAGTLFEAAPFVLAAALLPGRPARWFGALAGCGCGDRRLPSALSIPATALCWVSFGPAIALARLLAALGLAFRRGAGQAGTGEADPLAQLESLAWLALGLGLAAPSFAAVAHASPVAAIALGLVAGAVAPCATTAVALAGMLRGSAPGAAYALLAIAGFLPPPRVGTPGRASRRGASSLAAVGIACAALAVRGGHGLVHPRLIPMLAMAAFASACLLRSRTRASRPFVPAAIMLLALVTRIPPAAPAGNSTLDGAYAGERLTFTGIAADVAGKLALERAVITCCRADAVTVVLPTDLGPGVARAGTWLALDGALAQSPAGLYLHVRSRRIVAPPDDPFLYR